MTHSELEAALPHCLAKTELDHLGRKYEGKVRDVYDCGDSLLFVTTDRISAFDRVLGLIPYKGQLLNQLSAWWFAQVAEIVPSHLLSVPDPNVMIVQKAQMIPVEVVVRGYLTGVTSTSIWRKYEQGERTPYGVALPDGLRKNDPLPAPIITPTTKAEQGAHDEEITGADLVAQGLVSAELWDEISRVAIAIFLRGQELAAKGGLILVDTKYEFGLINGRLAICDELHTPDSSRFWLADSYDEQRTPQNLSKEYLREWYAAQGYRGEGIPPTMSDSFRIEVANRYIEAYERLTGERFVPAELPVEARLGRIFPQ